MDGVALGRRDSVVDKKVSFCLGFQGSVFPVENFVLCALVDLLLPAQEPDGDYASDDSEQAEDEAGDFKGGHLWFAPFVSMWCGLLIFVAFYFGGADSESSADPERFELTAVNHVVNDIPAAAPSLGERLDGKGVAHVFLLSRYWLRLRLLPVSYFSAEEVLGKRQPLRQGLRR